MRRRCSVTVVVEVKERGCEVTVAGRGSETEGIEFFFGRVSGAIYVVKGKMTRRTPHPATYRWPYEARRGIWSVINI